MSRQPFTLAAGISLLLLCGATMAMWARSYYVEDRILWNGEHRWLSIGSWNGRVTLFIPPVNAPVPISGRPILGQYDRYDMNGHAKFRLLGFGYNPSELEMYLRGKRQSGSSIVISYWFPLVAAMGLLCVLLRQHLHSRMRIRDGLCLACGYDLRATPDRCPECGTIPLKKETIPN
jgi:hypothetical protein